MTRAVLCKMLPMTTVRWDHISIHLETDDCIEPVDVRELLKPDKESQQELFNRLAEMYQADTRVTAAPATEPDPCATCTHYESVHTEAGCMACKGFDRANDRWMHTFYTATTDESATEPDLCECGHSYRGYHQTTGLWCYHANCDCKRWSEPAEGTETVDDCGESVHVNDTLHCTKRAGHTGSHLLTTELGQPE